MSGISRIDPEVPLVEFAEQDVIEVDRPHPVRGFFKPDVVLFQGLREEELLRLEAEGARVRDKAHQVVAGVLGVRQPARVRARRGVPDGRRRLLAERFVGPLVIVLRAEALKAALLAAARAGGRPGRLGLQRAVHPFVGAVLFRMTRLDALLGDPEADPPDVHRAQAMDAGRAEGRAVVRSDGARQADVAEEPVEHEPAVLGADRRQGVTGEQIAAMLVGDREGVAVRAIAGAEVALEVRGPHVVRSRGNELGRARMLPGSAAAAPPHESPAVQEIARRTRCGQLEPRAVVGEPYEQLAGTPARVLPPRLDDRRRDGGGDAVRTAMRRAASFCEPGNADVRIAREPLVARLVANAVPGAQLGHRVQPPIPVRDEVQPFLHGVRLRPRHAHLPVGSLEECHPCCRSDLLPMYPVCTVLWTFTRVQRFPLGELQELNVVPVAQPPIAIVGGLYLAAAAPAIVWCVRVVLGAPLHLWPPPAALLVSMFAVYFADLYRRSHDGRHA